MQSKDNELRLVHSFFDLIILNFSILLVGWFRSDISLWHSYPINTYMLIGNLSLALTIFLFPEGNVYLRDKYIDRFVRLTKRILIFIAVLIIFDFLLLPRSYSRSFILEFSFLFYAIQLLFYRGLYSLLLYRRKKGLHTNWVFIVGVNSTTRLFRKVIENTPLLGYHFAGFIDQNNQLTDTVGTPDQLEELIKKYKVHMIIAYISFTSGNENIQEYLRVCTTTGTRLRLISRRQKWMPQHGNADSIDDMLLINPMEIPLDNIINRILKRSLDLLISTISIVLIFSWFFPIVTLLIKLSSKGPVFFVQERTGINNKVFRCIKFRSMNQNGEQDKKQAVPGDERITRIGKFLRTSNIDELPQFINVLLGDMSIVGPRPHMLLHTQQYSALIDQYLVRHYVKPGITGWAQINGWRGATTELWMMQKRVEYDMEYIENWSLFWDIKIICQTIFNPKAYKNAG